MTQARPMRTGSSRAALGTTCLKKPRRPSPKLSSKSTVTTNEPLLRMNHLPEERSLSRRRFLGIGAMTIAGAQLGMIGCAQEQSSEETQGALMSEETTNTAAPQTFSIDVPEED